MTTDHERAWALYARGTGGTILMHYYGTDADAFEGERGEQYLRIGPVVHAWTEQRARELIDRALPEAKPRGL